MKRINYDGQSLVSGSAVAEALLTFAETVARRGASATATIPVLEDNGSVLNHSLLLTAATALETFDIDGGDDNEAERFPVPKFPSLGGKVVAVGDDDAAGITPPIED